MTFYQHCLGGELSVHTVGESPMSEKLPEQMKAHILHACLQIGDTAIMGTDLGHDEAMVKGNNVSTVLTFTDESEIRAAYNKLCSNGGKALHPLENTFWSNLFGDLVDQYGNYWMLTHEAH